MEFLFNYFVSNAILATGLALAVACGTRLWRNPRLAHLLWMVVLLKLVSPPLVPVPVDAFLPFARHQAPRNNRDVNRPHQAPSPGSDVRTIVVPEPRAPVDTLADDSHRSTRAPAALRAHQTFEPWGAIREGPGLTPMWLPILAAIWLTGSLLRLAIAGSRIVRFHGVARNMPPADGKLRKLAAGLARQLKLRQCPDIRVVDGRIPPMVWSASWKPLVLLPAELLARLDGEQQASLIMHELAHIRRRDHWIRWLEMAVLTICWWNPIAWWARSRIQRAEEECCDGWVVWMLPHCTRQYGKALLETVEFLNETRQPLPAMASGFGHVPLVKRRIEMIVKQRVAHRLAWPGGFLVLLVAVVVLPVAAQDPGAAQDPDVKPVVTLSEIEQQLKRFELLVRATDSKTGSRTTTEPSPATPAKVFEPLQSGAWTLRYDHTVDGKIVTNSWWNLQLDFRNDKVTGHVVKISDGNSSDSILSGQFIRAISKERSNPTSHRLGRFVSVLVLRQDTSDDGYFVIHTGHRVSENRFLGTWVDSVGQVGDFEMNRTEKDSHETTSASIK